MNFGIWNSIDEVALYLGLERLDYETDEMLFNRIKRFSKWKYRTDYYTQAHSVPLQIGLDFYNIAEVKHVNGKEFRCNVDWEYFIIEDEDGVFVRVFIGTEDCTFKKILDTVNTSGVFTINLFEDAYENFQTKFLIRNKNNKVNRFYVSSKNSMLANKNIMKNTFVSENSAYCVNRKLSISEIVDSGDYFLDEETGYLQIYEDGIQGFFVTYEYYDPKFIIEGSDMSLTPLNLISKYGMSDKLILLLPQLLNNNIWGK